MFPVSETLTPLVSSSSAVTLTNRQYLTILLARMVAEPRGRRGALSILPGGRQIARSIPVHGHQVFESAAKPIPAYCSSIQAFASFFVMNAISLFL